MTVEAGPERVTVGYIGIGIMGFHMARRLAQRALKVHTELSFGYSG